MVVSMSPGVQGSQPCKQRQNARVRCFDASDWLRGCWEFATCHH